LKKNKIYQMLSNQSIVICVIFLSLLGLNQAS